MVFTPLKSRTKQEQILMVLSATASVVLIPFIMIRAMAGEWIIALFDLVLFSVFAINGMYVYKSRKVHIARLILAGSLVLAMLYGFYLKGVAHIPWSYPALVAIFFAVRPKLASLFCTICIVFIAVFSYPLLSTFEFITFLSTLISTCIFVYIFANLTIQQNKALIEVARRDSLTKLRNRRAFDLKLDEFIGKYRNNLQTCLILFDVDYFKAINDEFGHSQGDEVLINLGQIVSKRMRRTDHLYRIGGEEFAIVLADSTPESAMNISEDIRTLIEQSTLVAGIKVTISLGVALYLENESKDSWFKRCDKALYSAKESGRNNTKSADIK
ncbi:MAG: hypothetical protein COA74_06685 [Gammaproteobacteria bacterium]|nr:MAG: hypothetical protein COA74_06685 [Gammaproteobacteria bacterium]